MSTVFDTNDFPAARRFVQWRDCASNLFLPVDVASRDHDAFRFHSVRRTIGDVVFSTAFARDDLVALAAAQSMGEEPLEAKVRRVATLYSARVFIDRNLPDRNLALDTVAAALKISRPHKQVLRV
jgi:hypothetical protein